MSISLNGRATSESTELLSAVQRLDELGCEPQGQLGSYSSFCPAHAAGGKAEGHDSRSFSLKAGHKQPVIVTCHSKGCTWQEIFAALDIAKPSSEDNGGVVVATYQYDDGAGKVVLEVDRIEYDDDDGKKKFLPYLVTDGQRAATSSKPKDVKVPLYRRGEVLAAAKAGGVIVVVEGEKCADTLRVALRDEGHSNIAVTTLQGGAGASLTAKQIQDFAGAEQVIVLADNDDNGKASARKRADAITDVVADVRLLEKMPDAATGGDVFDWLADDHKASKLFGIIDQQTRRHDAFGIAWQPDILKQGYRETEWDIEGIVERYNGPTLLTAPPETYKTWFAMAMALSVATGKPFLGHFDTRQRPKVFHINLDAGSRSTENRIWMLSESAIPNFGVMTWEEWDSDRFEHLLRRNPGAFVVIDCWSNIFINGESKVEQAEQMRTWLQRLRNTFQRYDANGVVIDHTPRNDGRRSDPGELFYGSQQKKATFRQGITLIRPPEDDDDGCDDDQPITTGGRVTLKRPSSVNIIEVHSLKMSEAEKFQPFQVEFKVVPAQDNPDATKMSVKVLGNAVKPKKANGAKTLTKNKKTIRVLMQSQPGVAMKRSEIESRTGLSRDAVLKAVADTSEFKPNGAGKSLVYLLVNETDNPTF